MLAKCCCISSPEGGHTKRAEISLRSLAEQVVFVVCKHWFGLDNVEKLKALVFTSRYAFQVQPGQWLHDKVHSERGAILTPQRQSALRTLREQLQDASYPEDKIQLALDGAMVGFAAPAIASITVVLDEWLQNGELARLSQRLPTRDAAYAEVAQQVLPVLLGTLAEQPIPSLLYRRALGVGLRELREYALRLRFTERIMLAGAAESAVRILTRRPLVAQFIAGLCQTAVVERAEKTGFMAVEPIDARCIRTMASRACVRFQLA